MGLNYYHKCPVTPLRVVLETNLVQISHTGKKKKNCPFGFPTIPIPVMQKDV